MIYLDFAATSKPSKEVLDVFLEVNTKFWANPASLHDEGIKTEAVLQEARKNILQNFDTKKRYDLIFTSGATESNNFIIKSVENLNKNGKKHIISSNIEHPSIREVLFYLQKEGFYVEFLPVNQNGMISVEQIRNAVKNDTILISIMHVNNEIGSINDVFEIAKAVKEKNRNIFFHSDFSQSVGKLNTNLDDSEIDAVSFSGHKIQSVKGIGAAIFRKNVSLSPLLLGGAQEFGLRAGTSNLAGAVALAKAVKTVIKTQKENYEKVSRFQNVLFENLQNIPEIQINSPRNNSPFIINFSVKNLKSETILRALSEKKIYVSTVSACSSKKNNESYVIKAITNNINRAKSSVRVSLSESLSENDIFIFIDELKNIIENYSFTAR
ncbi:MAG: cysteine desulfurase [Chitinispirillales bacterium]|jgi:cysteine desulfurase|nr:cysteine desulfurase [Chitinispirillales bacterium]